MYIYTADRITTLNSKNGMRNNRILSGRLAEELTCVIRAFVQEFNQASTASRTRWLAQHTNVASIGDLVVNFSLCRLILQHYVLHVRC
jgi:hypothetical protein